VISRRILVRDPWMLDDLARQEHEAKREAK
jgi:hypothetical protein